MATRVKLNLDMTNEAERRSDREAILAYWDNITRKSIFREIAQEDFAEREIHVPKRKPKTKKSVDPKLLELVLLTSELPPKGHVGGNKDSDEDDFEVMETAAERKKQKIAATTAADAGKTPKKTPRKALQPTSGNKTKRTLPWDAKKGNQPGSDAENEENEDPEADESE